MERDILKNRPHQGSVPGPRHLFHVPHFLLCALLARVRHVAGMQQLLLHPATTKGRKVMNIQMIPLSALVPSRANVRKTGSKIGIDELASSIAAHGLLQNLQVRPVADEKFQVVA
jgi:hypothetical protein